MFAACDDDDEGLLLCLEEENEADLVWSPSKRDTVRDRLKSGVTVALCAYMRRRLNNKLQNENWKRVHAKSRVIIILRFLLTYCARTSLSFPVKLWINVDAKFRSRSNSPELLRWQMCCSKDSGRAEGTCTLNLIGAETSDARFLLAYAFLRTAKNQWDHCWGGV